MFSLVAALQRVAIFFAPPDSIIANGITRARHW